MSADPSVRPAADGTARGRVYRYLRQAVMMGELAPGSRLVEDRIAADLAVSRTPVREALQRLTSEGLVVRIRRGHLEVCAVGPRERAEMHLLRVAFDEVVARLISRQAAEVDWDALHARLVPLEQALRGGGVGSSVFAMAHLDLHMAINRAAFSDRTSTFLESQAFLYPTDDYVQQAGYEPVEQHRDLLAALASGDEEHAVAAVLAHAVRGAAHGLERGQTAEPAGLTAPAERGRS
ncbi:Family transcriptional regulator [Frankia canadensis]|uniref:Family transcriptional regulator n=1 Tax=Frankia canadensis TaxID=1836972 RepID=A0A2I2KQR5_9ACTN|nr:GntR family transcriptional regulator [Frankia canadensis]SNQ47976.1 Family transcriptional regulator [Frankia canadensis]SOU55266.1 Family transcriptional regulator [Frankia canadensis]